MVIHQNENSADTTNIMNRLRNAIQKLRGRKNSSSSQQEGEVRDRNLKNPYRCAAPSVIHDISQFTPGQHGSGEGLSEMCKCASCADLNHEQSFDRSLSNTYSLTRISKKRHGQSNRRDGRSKEPDSQTKKRVGPRYNLIVDIGSGKDIPENKDDVRPTFTFELIEETVMCNELW